MKDPADSIIRSDLLPQAGGRRREYERKALEIRRFAGMGINERLDPFKLAELLKLRVVSIEAIDGLSEASRRRLAGSDEWSGGVTELLQDGSRVVVINTKQSVERQAATLMEEICHTLLGHKPSLISPQGFAGKGGVDDSLEDIKNRTYDKSIEDEAYSVGAAALLPYRALAEGLSSGKSVSEIAGHFGVTVSLVEYRMKVLNLWVDTIVT